MTRWKPTPRWSCGCPVGQPEADCQLAMHRYAAEVRAKAIKLAPSADFAGHLRRSIVRDHERRLKP